MRPEYNIEKGGISGESRALLDRLHRDLKGPFTVRDVVQDLGIEAQKVIPLLARWTSRGWLSRLQKGWYITVPLGTSQPSAWSEDAWVVAHKLFEPCYVGGWTACQHWGLTEQLFQTVMVFTGRKVGYRAKKIKAISYVLRVIPPAKIFGTISVWRDQVKVQVSSPAKTVADVLNDPAVGGGMRQVAEVVAAYLASEHRQDDELLTMMERLGNRAAYKRLGYLIETLSLKGEGLVAACRTHLSKGYSRLDPALESRGPFLRRWNLQLNTTVSIAPPS